MNKVLIFISLALVSQNLFCKTYLTGKVLNSKSNFVELEYSGNRSSGIPNFNSGIYNYFELLNEENEFCFELNDVSTTTFYSLVFHDVNEYKIILNPGDSLNLFVDLNDAPNTFIVNGKGSGMSNFHFAMELTFLDEWPKLEIDSIIPYYLHEQEKYLHLLNCFNTSSYENKFDLPKYKVDDINRILNQTVLNDYEKRVMRNRIKAITLTQIDQKTPAEIKLRKVKLYLQLYDDMNLLDTVSLNDGFYAGCIEDYIVLSCFNDIENKDTISLHNAREYYRKNRIRKIFKLLNGEVLQKYIADELYDMLLYSALDYDIFKECYLEYDKKFIDPFYRKPIDNFNQIYKTSLEDDKYLMDSPGKQINDSSIIKLLESFKGKKTYLVVWGVGGSFSMCPLSKLGLLNKLKAQNPDIRFVALCFDEIKQKRDWAAAVIQHNWDWEHYFYADGKNMDFIEKYKLKDVFQTCTEEMYYLINENGEIEINNGDKVITRLK